MSSQTHTLRETTLTVLKDKVGLEGTMAKDLEIGIFNYAIDFAQRHKIPKNWSNRQFITLYMEKARSVLSNLDNESYIENQRIKQRLLEKEFAPHEMPFMKPETIMPEVWNDTLDRVTKKENSSYGERPVASTNQFQCGKCRKRECVYTQAQTRKADEGMTVFIACINCGNRWKIAG